MEVAETACRDQAIIEDGCVWKEKEIQPNYFSSYSLSYEASNCELFLPYNNILHKSYICKKTFKKTFRTKHPHFSTRLNRLDAACHYGVKLIRL
jgi:hypothetical protein